MTRTKEIILQLLDYNLVESYRSMNRLERVHKLIDNFGCSLGVARNVANVLSTYNTECLFDIYYKSLKAVNF